MVRRAENVPGLSAIPKLWIHRLHRGTIRKMYLRSLKVGERSLSDPDRIRVLREANTVRFAHWNADWPRYIDYSERFSARQ